MVLARIESGGAGRQAGTHEGLGLKQAGTTSQLCELRDLFLELERIMYCSIAIDQTFLRPCPQTVTNPLGRS